MRVDPLTTISHGLSDNLEILWRNAPGKGGQRRSGDTGMRRHSAPLDLLNERYFTGDYGKKQEAALVRAAGKVVTPCYNVTHCNQ